MLRATLADVAMLSFVLALVGIVVSLVGMALSHGEPRRAGRRDPRRVAVWTFTGAVGLAGVAALTIFYAPTRFAGFTSAAHPLELWTRSIGWEHGDSEVAWFVWFAMMLAFARLPRGLPQGGGAANIASVFDFSSIVLFGPAGACILVGISGVLSNLGRPLHRLIFHFFQSTVTVAAAAFVFRIGGGFGDRIAIDSLPTIACLLGAALAYHVVGSALIARAIAWDESITFGHAWRRTFHPPLPHLFLVTLPIGALLAVGQVTLGFSGLVLTVPIVILAHLAAEGRLTRDSVHRHVLRLVAHQVDRAYASKPAQDPGHSLRVAAYATRVAWELGASPQEADDVELAALLHDLSNLATLGALAKEEALSSDEWTEVTRHPVAAWTLLGSIPGLDGAAWILYHHHERIDGTGYPFGKEGDDIPLGARVLMVVDAFDAMIHDRAGRTASRTAPQAYRELRTYAGTQFCPRAVEAVIRLHQEGRLDDQLEASLERLPAAKAPREPDTGRLSSPEPARSHARARGDGATAAVPADGAAPRK